jgi:hypothetical protein
MRRSGAYLYLLIGVAAANAGCLSGPWFPSTAVRRRSGADHAFREPLAAGQLIVHADFSLPSGHRMISELTSERQLICDWLGVPPGEEPIHVYLFADEAAYRDHVARKYPGFPDRRAIFVETDVKLAVYAHWSDRVAEDLRHEAAHGYLHSTVPNLPLWLDEGLAEYFEVGRGRRGVNRTHVDYLQGKIAVGGWQPNLARLEQVTQAGEMTQLDYAESWLWVHWLLESPQATPEVLTAYLTALRRGQAPTLLSATLEERLPAIGAADAALVEHLRSLAGAAPGHSEVRRRI